MKIFEILTGGLLGQVKDIIQSFKLPPEKEAELRTIFEQHAFELQAKELELESRLLDYQVRVVEAVNATMREEAKSEKWAQWLWRPIVGFTFSAVIINNFVLYPYFAKYGMVLVNIPDNMWNAMLVVLGAAAFTRGWQKVEAEKRGNGNGGGNNRQ